jgi:hypothetical protein
MNDQKSYELIKLDANGKYIILAHGGVPSEYAKRIEKELQEFLSSQDRHILLLNGDMVKIIEIDTGSDK